MMKNLAPLAVLALLAVVVVALSLLPLPSFWFTQLNYIGLFSLATLGLVLLTGVVGLTSFGQAAFVGIGAYTTAWLSLNWGLSPWLGWPAGLVLTALSAWLLGSLTLRMSGHYLPLATIAWALALFYLMGNLAALGKYDGLGGIEAQSLAGISLASAERQFALIWLMALSAAYALYRLLDSRPGRALRSIRQAEHMAEAFGINTFGYKTLAFLLAALLASTSGWLFAHFQRAINPSPFGMKMGIEYLFMAVLGGTSQISGAFIGAGLSKLLEDQLQQFLPRLTGISGPLEVIVFGLLLVLVLHYLPQGLAPWFKAGFHRWFKAKPAQRRRSLAAGPLPKREAFARGQLLLEVEALSKHFGGLKAVEQVHFSLYGGDILALIGPNGAGKSTTFNLISGALSPSAGRVSFGGSTTTGLSARAMAQRGLARTFQHVLLVPDMNVRDNVALGAHLRAHQGVLAAVAGWDQAQETALLDEAERQLARLGLSDLADQQAGTLAMGQQRLLEIARALCADPWLLLLDEPAAGLRHHEKQRLAQVLRQLQSEGLSLLLVEHDMGFVMNLAHRIVVMDSGRQLMVGTPEEVQQSAAVREAYLGVEA